MLIACPKCRLPFNPETQFAHCSDTGHAPSVPTEQHLPDALTRFAPPTLRRKSKSKKQRQSANPRGEFQSDFALLWDERPSLDSKFGRRRPLAAGLDSKFGRGRTNIPLAFSVLSEPGAAS